MSEVVEFVPLAESNVLPAGLPFQLFLKCTVILLFELQSPAWEDEKLL